MLRRFAYRCFTTAVIAAGGLVPTVFAADIVGARYDPFRDELVVDIAYRGVTPAHDFRIEWGRCLPDGQGGMYGVAARLIDTRGDEPAGQNHRVREKLNLDGLECRPARVTLRLGRVSHATVMIPEKDSR